MTDPKIVLRHANLNWQEEALEPTAIVQIAELKEVAQQMQREEWLLLDIVGVDYSQFVIAQPARFAAIYNCYHIKENSRVFLKVFLNLEQHLPSLFKVWRSANYLEREVYDLVGLIFDDHPGLRKILTPEDLEGHPLQKDFPIGESPTLFNKGRFLDPAAFRSGLTGRNKGLTGWKGGERAGTSSAPLPPSLEVFVSNVSGASSVSGVDSTKKGNL